MGLFLPNIPQAGDNLDFSQGELLTNNQGLDTVFGVDHYKFSNASVNKGFHNKVTTPQFYVNPEVAPVFPTVNPVTTTNPVLYAYQPTDGAGNPTTNLGLLQYSRGPSNAVPTPVTMLQSSAAATVIGPLSNISIFNFAGINRALCLFVATDTVLTNKQSISYVVWTGSVVVISVINTTPVPVQFGPFQSGSTLQLVNSSGVPYNNVYWTLEFLRIQ